MPSFRSCAAWAALGLLFTGCATARPIHAELAPLALAAEPRPPPVTEDHFARDHSGSLSNEHLRELLAAPVELEPGARIGVLPVAAGYAPGDELPLPNVPAELGRALEGSGLFDMATEVSTDWPIDSGVAGLRELAARYRVPYLLLYRHRFVAESYANGWAWLDATLIGALVTPNQTLETDGVLEATLFDVQSGTLLFTVFTRVHDAQIATVWHDDRKIAEMQRGLLTRAARELGEEVLGKVRRLAARHAPSAPLGEHEDPGVPRA